MPTSEAMYEEYQEGDENYYLEETHTDSFEQDLVQALDAGVRQTVNDALAKAITPLKHHLYGFAQQQGWLPPARGLGDESTTLPSKEIHSEAFQKLSASLSNKHPYSIPSVPRFEELSDGSDASSSQDSSKSESHLPRKRKAKTHHTFNSKQARLLTFEPGEIVHPRSTAWFPPSEVSDYVKTHISQEFDKEVCARLRSECS
ncbi:hypothetical protein NDU88_006843 [Pleurodeles waltl]|uniref:Uncharacterized protein n=1 Tax=Pleurodeles waltl TaxID=8319 RepID=A0AAV7UQA0_PLEWA|nr:hypothetical protein NDU88_006843 [Pleurodeles waltl]